MPIKTIYFGAAFICLSLVQTSYGDFSYTAQDRNVAVSAKVSAGMPVFDDSQQHAAPDFGPFNKVVPLTIIFAHRRT